MGSPYHYGCSAFRRSPSKAGRGVAFLKLARAKRRRWLVLSEFAKYAFFWPDKAKSCFRAQRTQVREHQKQDFNAVRPKKSGLRKYARQALAPGQRTNFLLYFSSFPQVATIPTSKLPCNFKQIFFSPLAIKSRSWRCLP